MRRKFTCYRCGKYVEAEMDDDGDATCLACENVIDLEPERKLQNRISTLEAENELKDKEGDDLAKELSDLEIEKDQLFEEALAYKSRAEKAEAMVERLIEAGNKITRHCSVNLLDWPDTSKKLQIAIDWDNLVAEWKGELDQNEKNWKTFQTLHKIAVNRNIRID